MALKIYASMAKELKLKVRKFWGVFLTFVKVKEEKLVGETFLAPILNRVKELKDDLSKSFEAQVNNWIKKLVKNVIDDLWAF